MDPSKIPSKSYNQFIRSVAAFVVAISGSFMLLEILLLRREVTHPSAFYLMHSFDHTSRSLLLIGGMFLIYLSYQLLYGRHLAWILANIALMVILCIEIWNHHFGLITISVVLTLTLLYSTRQYYQAKSDMVSLKKGLINAFIIYVIVIAYAVVGYYRIGHRDIDINLSLLQSIKAAFIQIFTFLPPSYIPHTMYERWFLSSVDTLSLLAFVLAVSSIFRPVSFILGVSNYSRHKARYILNLWHGTTEDYFKLWPYDKHYYFDIDNDAFLAYSVSGGCALILDGPSGNPVHFKRMLKDFQEFSWNNSWNMAIIHADSETKNLINDLNFDSLFVGTEAVINIKAFVENTAGNKHFRYVKNKSERDGLQFSFWKAPLSDEQVKILRQISDSWKLHDGRKEFGFAMGYFDDDYIRGSDCAVCLCHTELVSASHAIAYVNLVPSFDPEARTIDQMRSLENSPSTTMHYLLMQLIQRLDKENVQRFNLGLSPLAGIENLEDKNLTEKLMSVVKIFGNRWYAFTGLEMFKNKFDPKWEPRYICYQPGPFSLLRVLNGLNLVMKIPVEYSYKRLIYWLAGFAGLTYISFFWAIIFNTAHLFSGQISELELMSQPNHLVFMVSDIISGILMLTVVYFLVRFVTPDLFRGLLLRATRSNLSIIFYSISAVGLILSVLAPLPDPNTHVLFHYHYHYHQIFYHNIFSAMDVGGIILSACFIVSSNLSSRWSKTCGNLTLLLILLIIITTFGSMTNIIGNLDIYQRILTLLSAIWIVIFPYYIMSKSK